MRAALHHLAWDAEVLQLRIVASLPIATPGTLDGAARMRRLTMGLIPVGGPLPDIADHVHQAVAVGWKRPHGGSTGVPVLLEVLDRELALPGVRHPLVRRGELVTPRELGAIEAPARRELPLGLGRQPLADPLCVRHHV